MGKRIWHPSHGRFRYATHGESGSKPIKKSLAVSHYKQRILEMAARDITLPCGTCFPTLGAKRMI
jgi:hypothetical protein